MSGADLGGWVFPGFDAQAAVRAAERQYVLTKPRKSLGRLEELPEQLAAIQGDMLPKARPAAAILFAADHPVCAHGVSAYPSEVTAAIGALTLTIVLTGAFHEDGLAGPEVRVRSCSSRMPGW